MTLKIKTFEELTTIELYELLQLRSEVFIVEKGGRYQDLDRIDYQSVHIFYEDDDRKVAGCLRIFPKEDEPGTVQVGRVVTRERKQGLGAKLMQQAVLEAKERFGAKKLYLTGRKSALGFYLKCGFHPVSEELSAQSVPYYELERSI